MNFQISFKVSDKLYLRDPESSELGRKIVQHAIKLIHVLGYEHFTFKKLATEIHTTEAGIYRYFENKHRLLLYILNWYWSYMELLVVFQVSNLPDHGDKLRKVLELLTQKLPDDSGNVDFNKQSLNEIVIRESSKAYLVKEVSEINKEQVFKPYKELCTKIAEIIHAYCPNYPYPHSLSSTIIEEAHHQQFFSKKLPSLTDNTIVEPGEYTYQYLHHLLFGLLDPVRGQAKAHKKA
ncbi:MAG: TetR/AcrR family transcriptional regulator [Chitinophagaceae bacterium]